MDRVRQRAPARGAAYLSKKECWGPYELPNVSSACEAVWPAETKAVRRRFHCPIASAHCCVDRDKRQPRSRIAGLRPSDRTTLRRLPHHLSRADALRPPLQDRRLYDGRRRLERPADRRHVHGGLHAYAVATRFAARPRPAHQRQSRLPAGFRIRGGPALWQSGLVHPGDRRSDFRRRVA